MRSFKYFYYQFKRFIRALPAVIMLSIALFACVFIAFEAVIEDEKNSEKKYEIGIVGDASDTYLRMGIAALKNFDATRFAINVSFVGEDEAKDMLKSGELSAYIVIPENFIMDAYHGQVGKLTYVTTTGALGAVDYIKDELLNAVSVLLVESQKGTYAAGNIGSELKGLKYGKVTNDAAIEYVDLILARSKMYKLDVLGVSEGLGFAPSIFCGVIIFFILLLCIGFSPVFARNDVGLMGILSSRGIYTAWQVIGEYFAFLLCSGIAVSAFFGALSAFLGDKINMLLDTSLGAEFFASLALSLLMFTAMQMLIFEVSEGIWSGVLSQFLSAVFLSYFSGCLYPIYFFPEIVQRISIYLPAGAARLLLSRTLTDNGKLLPTLIIFIYFAAFISLTIFLRHRKIRREEADVA